MHFTITPSAPNQIKYTKNLNIEELKYWPARCVLEVDGTSRGNHTSCLRGRGKPYHARSKMRRPLARPPDPPISLGGRQGWRGGWAALKAQRHLPSRPRRSRRWDAPRLRGAGVAGGEGPRWPGPLVRFRSERAVRAALRLLNPRLFFAFE